MKKNRYILSLSMATMLLIGCSETLEDTYGDVTDGGKIRYVAKCSNLNAAAGWERLVVEWKNGTDATIDKIKLVWTYDGKKDSVLLDRSATSYELKNLSNTIYRFDITALDEIGNKSLSVSTYGRPYTREHEIMNAFTRGVIKSYFLNGKMVFFADKWNANISEMKLQYKTSSGIINEFVFDKETTYGNLITIDDVSMNPVDTVYVLRRGTFEGSIDEITFDPYPISRQKNYSSGFLNFIEGYNGLKTDTKENEIIFEKFINEVTELEFDYDIETFEDLLYCPNLKKIIFGKNRFISANYEPAKFRSLISGNNAKSKLVVEKAVSLMGLEIEFYGLTALAPHYFNPIIKGTKNMGKPVFPTNLVAIEKDAYKKFEDGELISCTPIDPYAELSNLLDNNNLTSWEAMLTQRLKNHEMIMELKEITKVSGVKFSQPLYDQYSDNRTPFFMPKKITIETSIDGSTWQKVTYFETNIVGRSSGEVTYLKFPEGKRDVRYVKLSLQDCNDKAGNWSLNIGDIVLIK